MLKMSPNSTKFGGVSSSPGDFLTSAPDIPQEARKTAENFDFAAQLAAIRTETARMQAEADAMAANLANISREIGYLRHDLAATAAAVSRSTLLLAALAGKTPRPVDLDSQ
jgi:hypothetical protein